MHGATEAPKTSVIVGLLIQADKAGALARFERLQQSQGKAPALTA